ncbi:hypothetical protein D3C85_877110 [compost metagenome]
MHRAHGLVIVHIAFPQLRLAEHPGVVAEGLAHHAGFVLQEGHLLLPMRRVQMPPGLRVAFHLGHQALPVFKALADLGVQPPGRLQPPARDPLRPVEAPGRVLPLAAVAAGAAPYRAVGLQHHGLHAEVPRQRQRRRQTGEARADDHHVGIDIAVDGAVVFGRRARRGHPIGGRVVLALAGGGHQRIIGRVVRGDSGAGAGGRAMGVEGHLGIHAAVPVAGR